MEWLLTLGVAALTGGVTLGGVALQNGAAARRAKAERDERERAEKTRIEREDTSFLATQQEAEHAAAAVLAAQVAEKFLDENTRVLAFREISDEGFRTGFETEWRAGREIALRRVVGRVRDDQDRAALMEILDALSVQADYTRWNRTRTPRAFVESALLLGLDVAMTMERGQAQGKDVISRRADLGRRIGEWEHYVAMKEASEWGEARREFKLEELRWEAEMEDAQEAQEEYDRESAEEAQFEADAAHEAREAARGAEELMHRFDDEPDVEER